MSYSTRIDAADVKLAVGLSDVIGLTVDWDARKSNPSGGHYWGCCPFHSEATPSFHVDDNKGYFYCHGCGAKGDHIEFVMQSQGLDFRAALFELAELAGIQVDATPEPNVSRTQREKSEALAEGRAARVCGKARLACEFGKNDPCRREWLDGWDAEDQKLKAEHEWVDIRSGLRSASEIWRASNQSEPVIFEYLAARGVDIDALASCFPSRLPDAIRVHPDLPYMVSDSRGHWSEAYRGPAMIGLIASPDFKVGKHRRIAGIHRTWITAEGRARIDGKKLDKRWRGATGHMAAVPIRLDAGMPCWSFPHRPRSVDRMIVGEGIETVLTVWSRLLADWLAGSRPYFGAEVAKSLSCLTGSDDPATRTKRDGLPDIPGQMPDWNRPLWRAPDNVDDLRILAEGSSKDPDAAKARYILARRRHAVRRDGSARRASLALPSSSWASDMDFADVAVEEVLNG